MSIVNSILAQALGSGEREGAFFDLLELDSSALPLLIAAYATESDPAVRALLVEVIWQRREPESISFLREALTDSNRMVWQAALDGLVARASAESLDVLTQARTVRTDCEQIEWIDEAIQQVNPALATPQTSS